MKDTPAMPAETLSRAQTILPQLSDLLERATRDLTPDLEALVAGGVRRGRIRQRRRRVASTVAGAATAVLVVAVGWQVVGGDDVGSRGIDPATTVPSAVNPSAPVRAELAVTTEQVPTTFASLEPGEVSAPSTRSGPDEAPVVDFTWNGFGVRVGITPDDYVSGESVPDPARRCAEQSDGESCRPGPGGTIISTWSSTSPPVDGGTTVRSVSVYRPDGWDVLVMAYNGPGKEGPVTAEQPPFDLQELERIAASDAWFS